jgi:hypothetical protein
MISGFILGTPLLQKHELIYGLIDWYSSFPRKRESKIRGALWMPAFAGMTFILR